MAKSLIKALAPIRDKNKYFTEHSEIVDDIIAAGDKKARKVAENTLAEVREAIKL